MNDYIDYILTESNEMLPSSKVLRTLIYLSGVPLLLILLAVAIPLHTLEYIELNFL